MSKREKTESDEFCKRENIKHIALNVNEFDVDGYNGIVFLTSEWENLNQDDWYAVSIGIYYSKEDAESILAIVKKKYSDAYIKYSGNYKK